ncbi:unnamed protein product [Prunus armeniaca]
MWEFCATKYVLCATKSCATKYVFVAQKLVFFKYELRHGKDRKLRISAFAAAASASARNSLHLVEIFCVISGWWRTIEKVSVVVISVSSLYVLRVVRRRWIQNPNRCAEEYLDGINDFIDFALRSGMIETYSTWNRHGEQLDKASSSKATRVDNVEPILDPNEQRLYMSKHTATDMRWHKEKWVDDDVMRHPADGEARKEFDRTFPEFAADFQNVRLGLATDGFNPYGVPI